MNLRLRIPLLHPPLLKNRQIRRTTRKTRTTFRRQYLLLSCPTLGILAPSALTLLRTTTTCEAWSAVMLSMRLVLTLGSHHDAHAVRCAKQITTLQSLAPKGKLNPSHTHAEISTLPSLYSFLHAVPVGLEGSTEPGASPPPSDSCLLPPRAAHLKVNRHHGGPDLTLMQLLLRSLNSPSNSRRRAGGSGSQDCGCQRWRGRGLGMAIRIRHHRRPHSWNQVAGTHRSPNEIYPRLPLVTCRDRYEHMI